MELTELKEEIINEQLDDSFLVFKYTDNTFLADQYVKTIAELKGLTINTLSSLTEITSALSLVIDYSSKLNVLKVETFDERALDYNIYQNTIVICENIEKSLTKQLEPFLVSFPKLLPWQIKDYVLTFCPTLTESELDWLGEATNNDIYGILNEVDKLLLFDKDPQIQHDLLGAFRYDPSSYLYQETIFNVEEAILTRNLTVLRSYLKHKNELPFDPIAIVNLLIGNLKKIALIKFNSGAKAEDIGVSQKAFTAFKLYLYKNYNEKKTFNDLFFLSGLDTKLKTSNLPITNNELIKYIICKLF